MDLKKLKEGSAYISKGIEEISQKLETLCSSDQCDSSASLLEFLQDVNTLNKEINTLLEVTRENVNHDKQLLKEGKTIVGEVEKQIASVEKLHGVSVLSELQQVSVEYVQNEDESKSSENEPPKLDESGNELVDVYDLLNKSFPKLL